MATIAHKRDIARRRQLQFERVCVVAEFEVRYPWATNARIVAHLSVTDRTVRRLRHHPAHWPRVDELQRLERLRNPLPPVDIDHCLQQLADAKRERAAAADRAAIDKAARKGLHHKNRAARLKSRLNTRLKAISG